MRSPVLFFSFASFMVFIWWSNFLLALSNGQIGILAASTGRKNLIGNSVFFVCVAAACYLYHKNPTRCLWAGMFCAMRIPANAFLHISCSILGREYSPCVVSATAIYIPGGIYFLLNWGGKGLLTWENMVYHSWSEAVFLCSTGKDFSLGQVTDLSSFC